MKEKRSIAFRKSVVKNGKKHYDKKDLDILFSGAYNDLHTVQTVEQEK